jgi:hydrogenase maturation protease
VSNGRTLVAGVGNVFLGDDGFGVAVAQRLVGRSLGPRVDVVDFGTRARELVFTLLDGYDDVILIDAVARGYPPGTVCVLELTAPDARTAGVAALQAHALVPGQVFAMVAAMGGRLGRLRLVGCEPAQIPDDDDVAVGLSRSVADAVPEAVRLVESLVGAPDA